MRKLSTWLKNKWNLHQGQQAYRPDGAGVPSSRAGVLASLRHVAEESHEYSTRVGSGVAVLDDGSRNPPGNAALTVPLPVLPASPPLTRSCRPRRTRLTA